MPTPRIFLSHAEADLLPARALATWLEQVFHEDVFVTSVAAGEGWRTKIFDALKGCSAALVLATPNSVDRFWVHVEIGALLASSKTLIPVYVAGADPAQWSVLTEIQHCLYPERGGKIKLLDAIANALGTPLGAEAAEEALQSAPDLRVELLRTPPARTREELLRKHLLDLIQSAGQNREELLVAGIANTAFFAGGADDINDTLREALAKGMRARFLFLDPESPTAQQRRQLEMGRLNTLQTITSCLETAREVRDASNGAIQIGLAREMALCLFANHERVVYHPYLSSATGAKMPLATEWKGSPFYRDAREHFDNLWGDRWALFDLGNVLLKFDHHRASRQLAERFGKASATEQDIFRFLFEESSLDSGEHDLAWLHERMCGRFDVTIKAAEFEEIWASVFDPPTSRARECLRRARELGVKIGIASNTNQAHWTRVLELWPELEKDTKLFLSFQLRASKTEARYWEKVVSVTRRAPAEHLLLDDLEENLAAARRVGFRTMKINRALEVEQLEGALDACYFRR